MEPVSERIDEVAREIVDAAFRLHVALGPGLLESVYEACMCRELSRRDIPFEKQIEVPIIYEGVRLESEFRLDLLVDDLVIVELKAVDELLELHKAQLLTYLKLARKRVGLLINFNVVKIKDGIRRLAY
jgi:GxxExxY protein